MEIKAKFEKGHFVPLENVEKIRKKYQNKVITIEILPSLKELKGVLKNIKLSSVELQHKGVEYFTKNVSDRH